MSSSRANNNSSNQQNTPPMGSINQLPGAEPKAGDGNNNNNNIKKIVAVLKIQGAFVHICRTPPSLVGPIRIQLSPESQLHVISMSHYYYLSHPIHYPTEENMQ